MSLPSIPQLGRRKRDKAAMARINAEYVHLAEEWQKWNNIAENSTSEKSKTEALKIRNKFGTKIYIKSEKYINRLVLKYTYNWEAYRKDATAAATDAVLTRAIKNWDSSIAEKTGKTFLGYIGMWVFNACMRSTPESMTPIDVPREKRLEVNRIKAAGEEIPEHLKRCDLRFVYMDYYNKPESDNTLQDLILNVKASQSKSLANTELLNYLAKGLTDKEKDVAIKATIGYTYSEIGEVYGVSKQRIRQIYNDAISKMRKKVECLQRREPWFSCIQEQL